MADNVFEINANLDLHIDIGKMPNVPEEKIKEVIGAIVFRFGFWKSCDRLAIMNDGENHLLSIFYNGTESVMVMGAIWREANQEFTFHT